MTAVARNGRSAVIATGDRALCLGWIDGIRKRIDDDGYTIRFTPRRPRSSWSTVDIKRAGELTALGSMQPPGLEAFEARRENRSGIHSYEQRSDRLPEPYEGKLEQHEADWSFFQARPPSCRKTIGWWVVSAEKEKTRLERLDKLIDDAAHGRRS